MLLVCCQVKLGRFGSTVLGSVISYLRTYSFTRQTLSLAEIVPVVTRKSGHGACTVDGGCEICDCHHVVAAKQPMNGDLFAFQVGIHCVYKEQRTGAVIKIILRVLSLKIVILDTSIARGMSPSFRLSTTSCGSDILKSL